VRLVCGAILDDDPRMRFFPRMIFQLAARSTRSCYVTLFFEALGPVQHDLRSLSSSFNESQHTESDSSALSEHEPIPTPFAHPELAVLPSSSHSPPPYTPNIRKATNVAISPSTVGLMLTGRIAPVKNLDVDVKFLQRES
jgi:hypothetical protein